MSGARRKKADKTLLIVLVGYLILSPKTNIFVNFSSKRNKTKILTNHESIVSSFFPQPKKKRDTRDRIVYA